MAMYSGICSKLSPATASEVTSSLTRNFKLAHHFFLLFHYSQEVRVSAFLLELLDFVGVLFDFRVDQLGFLRKNVCFDLKGKCDGPLFQLNPANDGMSYLTKREPNRTPQTQPKLEVSEKKITDSEVKSWIVLKNLIGPNGISLNWDNSSLLSKRM